MSMPAAYRRLRLAGAIDSVGDGAFAAAVPLLAITITRDPRLMSVISAAATLPWLLVSLPVGAVVDRHDRVMLMWRSQVVQAITVAVIAVLAALGHVGIAGLAVLAFVLGCGEVVFSTASQSALPELVPVALLHKANGQQYALQTVGQLFIGPPLGSLLFGVAVGVPFGVDAASFAISAALLATLPRRARSNRTRPPMRREIADGLRYLAGDRLLRTLAIVLGANTFCGQFGAPTLVLFTTQTFHVTASAYGVVLAGSAAGAVLGGLVNARVVAVTGESSALVIALIGLSAAYLGIGLAPNIIVLAGAMAVSGFLVTLWNIVTVTVRQELVPAGLLGRVNSVYRMLGWGLMPLGSVAGGFIAHSLGLRGPYVLASAIRLAVLVVAVPVLLSALRAVRAPRDVGDRRA